MEEKNVEDKMAVGLGNKRGKGNIGRARTLTNERNVREEEISKILIFRYIKQKENRERRFPMYSLIYLFTSNILLLSDVSYKQSPLFVREILVNKSSIILSGYTEWNL